MLHSLAHPSAQARSEELMKMVVKDFPDYQKTAAEIFPDMDLGDAGASDDEE